MAVAGRADHERLGADVRRAPLSLGAFRRRLPDANRPYRLPAAGVLSPLAFIIANLIIMWTGWDTVWKLGVPS